MREKERKKVTEREKSGNNLCHSIHLESNRLIFFHISELLSQTNENVLPRSPDYALSPSWERDRDELSCLLASFFPFFLSSSSPFLLSFCYARRVSLLLSSFILSWLVFRSFLLVLLFFFLPSCSHGECFARFCLSYSSSFYPNVFVHAGFRHRRGLMCTLPIRIRTRRSTVRTAPSTTMTASRFQCICLPVCLMR